MQQNILLSNLEGNAGQIPGVNQNPRDLENDGFELTKKSIKEFPEMLAVRQLVVVEHNKKYVVIGGNQRLRALNDLGYTEAPCVVVKWSNEQINEFIIKDNLSYGQWNYDLLANEWDVELLTDWGMLLPVNNLELEQDFLKPDLSEKIKYMFKLEVDCKNEETLESLYNEIKNRGLECRILTL